MHCRKDDIIRRRTVAAKHPVDIQARLGRDTYGPVDILVGTNDARDKSAVGITVVVRVVVRHRVITSIVIITDKVVTSRNLAAGPETATKRFPCVVHTTVNDTDFDSFALVPSGLDSVSLDLGEVGERRRGGSR